MIVVGVGPLTIDMHLPSKIKVLYRICSNYMYFPENLLWAFVRMFIEIISAWYTVEIYTEDFR